MRAQNHLNERTETAIDVWQKRSTAAKFIVIYFVIGLVMVISFFVREWSDIQDLLEMWVPLLRHPLSISLVVMFAILIFTRIAFFWILPLPILVIEAIVSEAMARKEGALLGDKGCSALAVIGLCVYALIVMVVLSIKSVLIVCIPIGIFMAISIVGVMDDVSERRAKSNNYW